MEERLEYKACLTLMSVLRFISRKLISVLRLISSRFITFLRIRAQGPGMLNILRKEGQRASARYGH